MVSPVRKVGREILSKNWAPSPATVGQKKKKEGKGPFIQKKRSLGKGVGLRAPEHIIGYNTRGSPRTK